jgi:signal transduction histidine kinase
MVMLRVITPIIASERSKNRKKYLEFLTATVSHEMMTPLNSIINLSKILLKKFREGRERQSGNSPCKDCEKYTEIINNSANFLHFMVKDMLDLSKV